MHIELDYSNKSYGTQYPENSYDLKVRPGSGRETVYVKFDYTCGGRYHGTTGRGVGSGSSVLALSLSLSAKEARQLAIALLAVTEFDQVGDLELTVRPETPA